jgi:hypothetical protein
LSGPTNGISAPAVASVASSSLLSMFTTTTPAFCALRSDGTSARESAGATTIASTPLATICSTSATCCARSLSSLMPLTISS